MAKKKKSRLSSIISGRALANSSFARRLPLIAVGLLFMLIYIGVGFSAHKKNSKIQKLKKEIVELRTISVTTATLRIEATKRDKIELLLAQNGLELGVSKVPIRNIE